MATKKATIQRSKTDNYLVLETSDNTVKIILTDDNPNSIMTAFNSLLLELKKGLFQYELQDTGNDLYYHICVEYIKQLNIEMKSVYNELKDYNLINIKEASPKKK
ncbi:MAG: hypothetical protein ACN4EP_11010 [Sediminibacterium sp.]